MKQFNFKIIEMELFNINKNTYILIKLCLYNNLVFFKAFQYWINIIISIINFLTYFGT